MYWNSKVIELEVKTFIGFSLDLCRSCSYLDKYI